MTSLIPEQKTFYSLEVYPPSECDDAIFFKSNIDAEPIHPDILELIMKYVKEEWIPEDREIPLYKFCLWPKVDSDMKTLSNKFKNYLFVLFGKGEYFIDNVFFRFYKNGNLVVFNNDVDQVVSIKLPNGDKRLIVDNMVKTGKYDLGQYFDTGNKTFMDNFNIVTNIGTMLGSTVASLGSMASEAAMASKILSVGVSLLDEMQRNLNNYGKNRGKCKHLADRCANILVSLQNIPSKSLNLQYVMCVINQIQESRDLINEYLKRWRITRFFLSGEYLDRFDATNQNLSDYFYDFAINYQLSKKN
jgi:hypothetical protein